MTSAACPPPPVKQVSVTLRITQADIDAMDYWCNEAPMSDLHRHNAIIFALHRVLRGDLAPRLEPTSGAAAGPVSLVVDGVALPLPPLVAAWWERARTGHRMEPLVTAILLPRPWLRPLRVRPIGPALPRLAFWKPQASQVHAA
jgi:hypothetical protein